MKIYLYCPETGIYQGEDFADDRSMKSARERLAPGCTATAPPAFGRGEVPVFHFATGNWELRRLPLSLENPAPLKGPPGDKVPAPEPCTLTNSAEKARSLRNSGTEHSL